MLVTEANYITLHYVHYGYNWATYKQIQSTVATVDLRFMTMIWLLAVKCVVLQI